MIKVIKEFVKNVLKLSPVPLTQNHKYDLLTKKIIAKLEVHSNCIDVGCFKGEILDLMLAAAPKGKHFGIEPIPRQFEYLSQKYSSHSNCDIINIAASNVTGQSSFNYVISNPSYSGLKKRDYDKANEKDASILVHTELLDRVIPSNLQIHLIKIDVEGAELLVLEGAQKIIARNKPIVIFEHGVGASDHYGTRPQDVYDFFARHSMKVSSLTSYIKSGNSYSLEDFKQQYQEQKNYYFIAHP